MWNNDSTYRGNNESGEFYFKSPIAKLEDNEDEFSRHWIYLSEQLKNRIQSNIRQINDSYGLPLPKEDDLTSYENPDYLWLAYELENVRAAYNRAMTDPTTGEPIEGVKNIPYVQLRLKANAVSKYSMYPRSTINAYGREYKPHYVVEFEAPFLKAFMSFITQIFDDNPQTYVQIDGEKYITHQYKAPIYRMEPFNRYFETRHDLPGIIFHSAILMMLSHELAHIGCGHLDLQAVDTEYGNDKNVMIAEEDDADAQAICWVLGMRFLEAPNDVLDIGCEDFKQELSLAVFAVYLLYTWLYSKEERVWNEHTVSDYGQKSHLPYQLRAFNMLSVAYNRLYKLGTWCERDHICTADGMVLSDSFFEDVTKQICQMIDAFERSYYMFFAKTEDVYELALNGQFEDLHKMALEESDSIPQLEKECIPLLLGFEEDAQKELKRVHDLWEDVRKHLVENGTYCKLREFEEWIPLSRD